MICQDCKKNEAQVHFTQIVNNEKTTLALCKQCAAARGFHSPLESIPFPLAEILSSLVEQTGSGQQQEIDQSISCPTCGLTFQDFTRQGRFGCGDCYRTFRHRLEPIMRKIHGASMHRGRMPTTVVQSTTDGAALPVKEEERLQAELAKAIEAEDFERAAEIRDKLKAIREVPLET